MFLTQYDTSVQKPLLIVLPKVFKKVSFLLLRIHQYKFRRWSLCFSLRDSVYEIQYTRFSISQGKLEFPISVPHYDEELRSLRSWGSQGSGCEGLMSTSNSAQRSLVVRVGSADLGQWYTLLWSVLLGHFTAVLWALNRFPPALFSTLTLSSPFSLVSFSFFIWSYHTIYRVP